MLGDSEVQTQQFFTRDPLQPTPATYRYIFNANNGVGHGKRRRSNGWQVIVAEWRFLEELEASPLEDFPPLGLLCACGRGMS